MISSRFQVRWVVWICVLFFGVAIMSSGCRHAPPKGNQKGDKRVVDDHKDHILLIGVDGLEWNVVLPLIRAGRMPNLKSLMERGCFGKLRTLAPGKSPVIWTTIATGKRPNKHGILDFIKHSGQGKTVLYTSRDRKTQALWNILTDVGRSMVVIGWWNTFPVETINGLMVSQANSVEQIRKRQLYKPGGMMRGVAGQVFPSARQDEMLAIVEGVDEEMPDVLREIFGDMGAMRSPVNRSNWQASKWSVRADESYRRIALKLAVEGPLPDCFAAYFGMTDVVGHRFWRFYEPDVFQYPPGADAIRRFARVIPDAYAKADQIIGELVSRFPRQTTVFVMSDHGMHAYHQNLKFTPGAYGKVEVESGAHKEGPPGILVVAGPRIRTMHLDRPITGLRKRDLPEIGSVEDITPTILALLDEPIGRDMDGVVLGDLLKTADRKKLAVQYVDTYDTPQWLAERGQNVPQTPGEKERIEQLRSLGYLAGTEEETSPKDGQEPAEWPASQPAEE